MRLGGVGGLAEAVRWEPSLLCMSQVLSGDKDRAAKQRWGDDKPSLVGSPREARLGGK